MPNHFTEEVVKLYIEERISGSDIAKRCGSYPKKIYRILAKNGIKRRSAALQNEIRFTSGRLTSEHLNLLA